MVTKADEFLNSIRAKEKEIIGREYELEALEWKATGAGAIRYDKVNVQISPENYMEMAIADIDELEQEIEELKASIEELKGKAYSLIRRMEIPDERAVLEWYYLNGKSVSDIIQLMHMSERSVYNLRDDALDHFAIIYNQFN